MRYGIYRIYSYGQWRYRITNRQVDRWDPFGERWLTIGKVASRRDGRHMAAGDAYARGLNP